ncbi:MAG: hypothetical protein FD161_4800 [Limisphaerales bacterium]|nr:MAG: hypothetical protein FD161_4800 [Limisphaerales bacterium]TXT44432.1 MAG: hypothetical protein FD140_4869 [Limisphaerales bacterium]
MGLILDTSLLVAHERRKFDLPAFLLSHADEPVAIAAITYSELLHGWHRAADPRIKTERALYVAGVRRDCTIVPFTEAQAEHHARVWAELESRGVLIGAHDLQIAATALSLDYAVATLNEKEFARVPGLRLAQVERR